MKHIYELPQLRLDLFDGEGEASGASGETQASPADAGQSGNKTGGFQNVIFGKQDAAAAEPDAEAQSAPDAGESTDGSETQESTPEERRKAYREMISQYKDEYTEDTQRLINARFKETRQLQEQLGAVSPILDTLMARYGIKDGDVSKLQAAIDNDEAYWQQRSADTGMEVEQLKRMDRLIRQNEAFRREREAAQRDMAVRQQLAQWNNEAQQLQSIYPSFDLGAESRNREFVQMLRAGVDMRHAYEVLHMDEIKQGVARRQAAVTEKQVVQDIRAKGTRPMEAGTSGQSPFLVKDDVSTLTKEERAEIARRVERGERISF